MVGSREVHDPRKWLFYTSFRAAEACNSAFLVTVQLQESPMNLCLVRQVPAAPSAWLQSSLVWPSPPLALMVLSCISLTHFGPFLFLVDSPLFQPALIWKAQHRTSCVTSYDVSVLAIFASSSVSFTFLPLPSLVRARVPSDTGAYGMGGIRLPWLCHESL